MVVPLSYQKAETNQNQIAHQGGVGVDVFEYAVIHPKNDDIEGDQSCGGLPMFQTKTQQFVVNVTSIGGEWRLSSRKSDGKNPQCVEQWIAQGHHYIHGSVAIAGNHYHVLIVQKITGKDGDGQAQK